MSERKEGWYWVKVKGEAGWQVGEFQEYKGYYLNGRSISVGLVHLEAIGPRIPAPDEPWKVVPKVLSAKQYLAIRQCYGVDAAIAFEEAWEDALESATNLGEEQ